MNDVYIRNVTIEAVRDGDTLTVEVDLGYRLTFTTPLRFNRINAPELTTKEGKLARDWLKAKMPIGSEIQIQTFKNPTDKYGRYLADITFGGESINDLLVEKGYAKYWDGKGVKPV